MSKASCCCGLSASAAAGFDATGRIAAKTAKIAIPKRFRGVKPLRLIVPNILLSHKIMPAGMTSGSPTIFQLGSLILRDGASRLLRMRVFLDPLGEERGSAARLEPRGTQCSRPETSRQ